MKIRKNTLSYKAKQLGYSIVNASTKYYIQKDHKPVKWHNGFNSISAAINFIEGHNYVTATIDTIDWSEDDLQYLLDTYKFKRKADNVWISKIDNVILTLTADKTSQQITLNIDEDGLLTIKEFSNFDKVIETVDRYFYEDDVFASISLLPDERVKQIVTAAKSSRDIARNLVRVRSSNLWAYGMDIRDRKDKTGTLVIQFKGRNGGPGDVYIYYDVPVKLWREFISAPSKGHFFWMNIRNNFWYRKLTSDKRGKLPNAINN